MTTTRRNALLTLSALAIPGSLVRAATPLKISYTSTPEFGAVFIAKERGIFTKHGLDVTLISVPVAPNVPAALMSDSVQLGGTTTSVLLQAIDSGLDLVGVSGGGSFDTSAPPAIGLVARKGLQVESANDLVGRKIGVPGFGAALHVLVRKWMLDQGVDPKKASFIEVQVPQMADVLKGGNVDAVVVPEPFVSRMVQSQIGTPVASFNKVISNGAATVLYAATRQWATANAATVKAFRASVAEAVTVANTDRAAAYEAIGKYFNVPPEVLRATPYPHLEPVLTADNLRFWIDAMKQQNMLKKPVSPATAILP